MPTLSPMEVREAILMTASMAEYPNNTYGWGIMDADRVIELLVDFKLKEFKNFFQPTEYFENTSCPFNPSIKIEIISIGK